MADQRATINAWLIEYGYLTALEEMADEEPLANVAEAVREIIESEAPELARDAPWLAVAAGFARDSEGVTVVADTVNGFTVCELTRLTPEVEYLEPDDFVPAIDQLQEGEAIATTFVPGDERLAWIDEEYGLQGWPDGVAALADSLAKEPAMPTMKTSPQLDRDLLRDAHTDLEAVRDMLREGDTVRARQAVGRLLGAIEARQLDWRNQRLGDWEYRYDLEVAAIHFESADGYRGRYQFDEEWLWFQCPGQDDMLQRGCREMREPIEVLDRAEELRQEHFLEEVAHRRLSGE